MVSAYSGFQPLTSRLMRTEDAMTMHLCTGWVNTLLGSLALPFVWEWPQTGSQWAGQLLMGTVGQFLLIHADRRAPAAALTPLPYLPIAFAMLGGWLIVDHLADGRSLIGMALIAACGALNAWLAFAEQRPPRSA